MIKEAGIYYRLDERPAPAKLQRGRAASGCRESPPEPLQAAFVAARLDSAGKILPQRIRKLGLSLLHLLRKLNCLPHLLFDLMEAPDQHIEQHLYM